MNRRYKKLARGGKRTGFGKQIFFIVIAVLLIVSAALAYSAFSQQVDHFVRIETQGLRIRADIVSAVPTGIPFLSGGMVTVRYRVGGQDYEQSAPVDSELWGRLPVLQSAGERLSVIYDANTPSWMIIDGQPIQRTTYELLRWLVPLGALATASFCLFNVFRQWLIMHGQLLTGELVETIPPKVALPGLYAVTFYFKFVSPQGKVLTGEVRVNRPDLREKIPSRGVPVRVSYRRDQMYFGL